MRTIYPTVNIIFLALFISTQAIAQEPVCSSITLTSQSEVNALVCGSINGNLIIRDNNDNIDNITSLDPIWTNGLQNGSVSGRVEIVGNNFLPNLLGLDGINSIGSNLIIENNGSMTVLNPLPDDFPFLLQSANDILIRNNPSLTRIADFPNLTMVNRTLRLDNNDAVTMINDFPELSVVIDEININDNANLQSVNAFDKLTNIDRINFLRNPSLTSIPTFPVLTTVTGLINIGNSNALQSITGFNNINSVPGIVINDNPNLNSVNAFLNINSISDRLQVNNNPSLSDCCWILNLVNAFPGTPNISGNGTGCQSLSQIGDEAPVFQGCVSDITVEINSDGCLANWTFADLLVDDDCGIESYTVTINFSSGGTQTFTADPGFEFSYSMPPGISTFNYFATDGSGNVSECLITFHILDVSPPTWTDGQFSRSVTGECGETTIEELLNNNVPLATDNCTLASVELVSATSGIICGNTSGGNYVYMATDDSGNTSEYTVSITLEDTDAPDLIGIPANLTINCNDDFPEIPIPTAIDLCDGNVTDRIILSSSFEQGSCGDGEIAQIAEYTWMVDDLCGNSRTRKWTITVVNDEEFNLGEDVIICGEGSYEIDAGPGWNTYEWSTGSNSSSITVDATDRYFVTVTGQNGCCFERSILVSFSEIPDVNAIGSTISCTNSSTQIFGSSSSSEVSYSWSGPGNFSSSEQNPTVNTLGEYTLTVTDVDGCKNTAIAEVIPDSDVPDLTVSGGNINCQVSQVTLTASSNTSGVSYSWTGPDGFSSTMQNITISSQGTYNVVVEAPNGCTSESNILVNEDISLPSIDISGGTLDCNNSSINLQLITDAENPSFSWSGPDGFVSSEQNPMVSEAGEYHVTVTGANFCVNTESLTIDENTTLPDISISGNNIDCTSNSADLMGNSTTEAVTYRWIGPNGFESTNQNITVSEAGTYILRVTAPNGCAVTESYDVLVDTDAIDVSLAEEILNCEAGFVSLNTQVIGEPTQINWTGPDGFTSNQLSIDVSIPGTYILSVQAANGCSDVFTYELNPAINIPDITAEGATFSCTDTDALIMASSTDPTARFFWNGPNGFTSDQANPRVFDVGSYTVQVTNAVGCTNSATVEVTSDADLPELEVNGMNIDCVNSFVTLEAITNAENVSYSWVGPGGITANEQSITIITPGVYVVTVESPNGCKVSKSFTVIEDKEVPIIDIDFGDVDCENSTARLSIESNRDDLTYQWFGPGGLNSTEAEPIISLAGLYQVTVTASNGCSNTSEQEIFHNIALEIELTTMEDSGNGDGQAQLAITNGTPPFEINWSNGTIGELNDNLAAGDYSLTITDGLGCIKIVDFTIEMSSSTDNISDISKILLYPNPTQSYLVLDWEQSSQELRSIQIQDINGKLIRNIPNLKSQQKLEIETSSLKSGVYFVRLNAQENIRFLKFLKI